MKKTQSLLQIVVLNTYWVGLSFMWNALHPIILPAVLLNYIPDEAQKNTYLGLLTFVGLIIAMIVQPISGALSDRWISRFGRRRPLIALGTLFDFVFLALIGWAGGVVWLAIGYVGLQFSSNVAHGPAQGLLPDRVPREQLDIASGIKTFMDLLSVIIASLVAGNLLDPSGKDPSLVIFLVMVMLAISTLITLLCITEEPTNLRSGQPLKPRNVWKELRAQFKIDFRANASYWWLIAERFLFLLGIYAIQQFVQYYIRDVLEVADPVKVTGNLMASLGIGLVLLALAGGWLTKKFGAKRILVVTGILVAIGFLFLPLARSEPALTLIGSIIGAGLGLFLTANWALATRLAPGEEAGKYLGLTNIATAGSAALGRLWGPALDGLNNAWPGMWYGYSTMFICSAVFALLSLLLLIKVKEA